MSDTVLRAPLTDAAVEALSSGDRVFISGDIYTARDAAHKRLVELLDRGEPLPLDLRGQIIYYAGPTPARPGRPIGSCGPTTSSRMDAYAERLLACGIKAMIGKGQRSAEVVEAIRRHRGLYLAAVGGAGAKIAQCVKASAIVAYEDLGPEAIRRLTVELLPVVVINDARGGDLYRTARQEYGRLQID
jgi:fumarate hydratase subunit beta